MTLSVSAHATTLPLMTMETTAVIITADVDVIFDRPQVSDEVEDQHKTNQNICSGVAVYSDKYVQVIATARHCAREAPVSMFGATVGKERLTPTSVAYKDGDFGRVEDSYLSKKYDIAFLKVRSFRSHASVQVNPSPLQRGDPLYVFGMPDGVRWFLSTAVSSTGTERTNIMDFNDQVGIECASCTHGDSGAGVYGVDGRVRGILSGGNEQGMTLIVPAEDVSSELRKALAAMMF